MSLQVEAVDEPRQERGVGPDAVVVAGGRRRETAAGEVQRQAAEPAAQVRDHVAEHEGPLPGADEQQRRA
jgi:hypothetical protein